MIFDVFQHKRASEWWLLDSIDADDAEDAILKAVLKSHDRAAGKYLAYEAVHDCAELEIKR